jgi:2-polyprenyl-3-methyl-5-hydroxy-6-metoxy-1,4-benzoquinol methylase
MSDPALYKSYASFKNWGQAEGVDRPEDFAHLLRDAGLPPTGLDILDFGFGEGLFLDWARSAGHTVTGVEILPEMVARARGRGHKALLAETADQELGAAGFDVIVLVDVLEHLTREDFRSLMILARKVLKPGGMVLAQFPNGDSPLFGRYHYGDLTHERPLTALAVGQWALPEGMTVVHAFNPRPVPSQLTRALKRRAAYLVRDLVEKALGMIYFGRRFPMDPNVAIILMRTEEANGAVV